MTRIARATILLLGLGLPLTVSGCDQRTIGNVPIFDLGWAFPDLATSPDLAMPPDLAMFVIPGSPLIGMQIDRIGRPAINTALTNPFSLVGGNTPNGVKNQYNATTVVNWGAYAARPYIAENLAIFDGLDGVCGNQLLAGAAGANRYAALATVLADDRLYLNTNLGTCSNYLAVEQGTAGDCGGRHPSMVAMDVTYNILASGTPTGTLTNGVLTDADGGIAFNAPFPFLLSPQ